MSPCQLHQPTESSANRDASPFIIPENFLLSLELGQWTYLFCRSLQEWSTQGESSLCMCVSYSVIYARTCILGPRETQRNNREICDSEVTCVIDPHADLALFSHGCNACIFVPKSLWTLIKGLFWKVLICNDTSGRYSWEMKWSPLAGFLTMPHNSNTTLLSLLPLIKYLAFSTLYFQFSETKDFITPILQVKNAEAQRGWVVF